MSTSQPEVSVNCLVFDKLNTCAPFSTRVPHTLSAQDCLVRLLPKISGFLGVSIDGISPSRIALYRPTATLSLQVALSDKWAKSVDPDSAFEPVPPSVPLTEFLTGLDDVHRVHLIIIIFPQYRPTETVTLWYRYVHAPEEEPGCIVIEKTASFPQLRTSIANKGLVHPQNHEAKLKETEIEIWQPSPKIPVIDKDKWEGALKEAQGNMDRIANKIFTEEVGSLIPRRNNPEKPILNFVVSSIYYKSSQSDTQVKADVKTEDELADLTEFYPLRFERLIEHQKAKGVSNPSASAVSSTFRQIQKKEFAIYDGRLPADSSKPASTIGMPPSFYHPVFQHFMSRAFDQSISVPQEVVVATAVLMQRASVLYEREETRRSALRTPLQNALRSAMHMIINDDYTGPDGRVSVRVTRDELVRDVPALIHEEKRESAEGNADATTQASFSMIRVWSDPSLDHFRNLACCPTFLIGFSGCHLVISAAVITDKCIVQRLVMMWVGHSSTHDELNTIRIARVFYALGRSFEELRKSYEDIIATGLKPYAPGVPTNHPRFFPYLREYTNSAGATVRFQYRYPLQKEPTCITFLATTDAGQESESEDIVVKFVQRYSSDLHILLASNNMAPALRYFGKIGDATMYPDEWKVVVMDHVRGVPSYMRENHLRRDVREAVLSAVGVAHKNGYVCGDIRPPNVLVPESGNIKLIDFDWSGKAGEVRYPAHMSTGLWPIEVRAYGVIEKTHDDAMIEKWFPGTK